MTQSHDEFQATRYWPQLDGMRTLSIVLVLIVHMGDPWWASFNGALLWSCFS
jgi:peptidoglycan/LPS O-acetylase OafA/YrhL